MPRDETTADAPTIQTYNMNKARHNTIGHMAIFAANIFWGFMSPVSKAVLSSGYMSSLALTTIRMIGAAAIFWLASAFTKKEQVNPHDLMMLFFASLFSITINQGCFIAGISMTSPIDASVVATTIPIITMIIAAMYLKEPVTSKKVLGIFLGAIGALILIASGGNAEESNNSNMTGNLLCLAGECSVAIYYVVFRDLIRRYHPVTLMKWMFTYATICCVPFSYSDISAIDFAGMPTNTILDIGFIIVAATFLSYLLVPVAQQHLRPTVISMYSYTQPIIASLLAVLWGMGNFTPVKTAAIVLVFAGVYVVNKSKSKAQMDAEEALKKEADSKSDTTTD